MSNKKVIYKIFFKHNPNLIYVGSAVNFTERKIRHKYQLKKNIHKNTYLQNLYNKYGVEKLCFEILDYINTPTDLIPREQYFISLLKPQLNILPTAGSAFGYKHTEEAKKKISEKNTGRKMTSEQIQKGVIARIGQKTSKGCKRSELYKKHLSEIKNKQVINLLTGEIFNSIGDAASYLGLKYNTFYAHLSCRYINNTNMEVL
jgi:group I intron endonuclease